MGLVMSLALTNQPAFLRVLFGIVGGVLAEAFVSRLLCVMTGGRRDFTSQLQVVASRYAVLASTGTDQVFGLLQHSPGNQMRPRSACRRPESKRPNEYGSCPDEKPRFGVRLGDGGEDGGAEALGDNEHAAPAQEPVETAMEPAEGSRKPLG